MLADVLERSGHMAGLEQRLAPKELPDARTHLQELYVAMMRAGEQLHLSWAATAAVGSNSNPRASWAN